MCNRIPSAKLSLITTCTNKITLSWFQSLTFPYYYSVGPVLEREASLPCKLISKCKSCLASYVGPHKFEWVPCVFHLIDLTGWSLPTTAPAVSLVNSPWGNILHWCISFLISWSITFFYISSLSNSDHFWKQRPVTLEIFPVYARSILCQKSREKVEGG